jgi:hypothetical protein
VDVTNSNAALSDNLNERVLYECASTYWEEFFLGARRKVAGSIPDEVIRLT